MRNLIYILIPVSLAGMLACSPAGGEKRGHEFMPDMVHATGYEANLYNYYYYNRWGTKEEYKQYASPRQSVHGTVARGEISLALAADDQAMLDAMQAFTGETDGSIAIHPNGSVPYYYKDTEEERSRAMREITRNPFPITTEGLERGKELYVVYCGICHGVKGDGQGYLVREDDPAKGIVAGVYPAAPANFMLDTFVNASPGRFYHSIMYGKNVMGSYADKLSYRERWEVIHYIRSLQAQSKKLDYSSKGNTFNQEATPWALVEPTLRKEPEMTPPDSTHQEAKPTEDHKVNKH